jgi:hypothetical protein
MAYISPNEIRFAYRLLTALGITVNSGYLLFAVIAWNRKLGATNPYSVARKLRSDDYATILKVLRRGGVDTEQEQQTQAFDFLAALALSKWDSNHYSTLTPEQQAKYGEYPASSIDTYDPWKNSLFLVWVKLLGTKVTIPADLLGDDATIEAPKPTQVRAKLHRPGEYAYLSGEDAVHFLEARSTRQIVQPGEPFGLPL